VLPEEPIDVVSELPRDLRHPRAVRVGRRPRDLDHARLQVDHEQRVVGDESARRPHLGCEEVARRDLAPVALQERAPARRPIRRGLNAFSLEDAGDGGGADSVPEILELALDARVAPGRVLGGHAQDEALDREHHASATLHRLRIRPLRRDQPAVPAHDRVGRDDGGELPEKAPTEERPLCCESSPLVIGESQAIGTELLSQDAVLFAQVVDRTLLFAVDPAGDGEEQGAQRQACGVHAGQGRARWLSWRSGRSAVGWDTPGVSAGGRADRGVRLSPSRPKRTGRELLHRPRGDAGSGYRCQRRSG